LIYLDIERLGARYLDIKVFETQYKRRQDEGVKRPNRDFVDRSVASWEERFPTWDVSGMQLALRLGALARSHQVRCEEIGLRYGLGPAGFPTLALIAASPTEDGLTPGDLMGEMDCPSGTLTHRLNLLERAGLIRREVDPNDRRSFRVHITPLGLQKLEACAVEYLPALHEPFANLTRAERQALESLLRKAGSVANCGR